MDPSSTPEKHVSFEGRCKKLYKASRAAHEAEKEKDNRKGEKKMRFYEVTNVMKRELKKMKGNK